jgi:hypothetical protein
VTAESEPVTAESESVTAEPVTAESEPVTAESESVTAEPVTAESETVTAESETAEPDTTISTLITGEYNATLVKKKDNAWEFEITIDEFIHKVIATYKDTRGYWQLFTIPKGANCIIRILMNETVPIVTYIKAVPDIIYNGWISGVKQGYGFLHPILKKKTDERVFIARDVINMDDIDDTYIINTLDRNMYVQFTMIQNRDTQRGENEYEVEKIKVLKINKGKIIELDHSNKTGKVEFINNGNSKEIMFSKRRLFSNFDYLKLMDIVSFVDDGRDNIIKFIPNYNE